MRLVASSFTRAAADSLDVVLDEPRVTEITTLKTFKMPASKGLTTMQRDGRAIDRDPCVQVVLTASSVTHQEQYRTWKYVFALTSLIIHPRFNPSVRADPLWRLLALLAHLFRGFRLSFG